jgi:hypothetical protein
LQGSPIEVVITNRPWAGSYSATVGQVIGVSSLASVVNSQVRTFWKTAWTSGGTTSVAMFDLLVALEAACPCTDALRPGGSPVTVPGSLRQPS